jgi:hypothetical protein
VAVVNEEGIITPDGYFIAMPRMVTVARPRLSLEMCAIAAGVFALVVSAMWMAAPAELVWFVVTCAYWYRKQLFRSGFDHVLDEACSTPARERYLASCV